ncbi:MAG: Putrescine aminotransferase [Pelotomaculum sp. PtaB.Bin013]|uniref:Aspartate aminotransferase family protein n=1 Tax=Pelotomaculum isophthalicicum JI TaxID=947010 RepID=A0A9X4H1A7_9FIRM|nr:aspartate aminotransferase family protein [Pelotomaculum isophthalicicum]MDF9407456.1 aspartate aminotransferase family protein [Pelotomaculum isophthalicicum JI]OPX89378.1 MAG: Putrescine aminotransferase [Pelotomaculum sp. PtaB.Bin013]
MSNIKKPDAFISLPEAVRQNREQVAENHKKYLNSGLAMMLSLLNFDKQFVKAEGINVWDSQGNVYLDFLGAYGALNLGHNHPRILAALDQVKELPNMLQASLGTVIGALARNLAAITPGDLQRSFFCNSGAEAVEGALKLARAATGRRKLVYCNDSFHGKTIGALSVTGREKYQKAFQPLIPDADSIPFGDLTALEGKLREKTAAAFIVEPIQGEGGIILPPAGYLSGARQIGTKYNTLLIFDEIQTGLGRTGKMFACQHENVTPDIMCLAKSLGGGIMPVGAFITTNDIWERAYGGMEKALLHTSTFGGNTRAAAAAIATLEVIYDEDLPERARENGDYLLAGLRRLKDNYPLLKDVRGCGLMAGIEFNQPEGFVVKATMGLVNKISQEYLGSLIAGELLNKYRIITAYTLNNPNVIRLEPPLTVTREQIDTLLEALDGILGKHKDFISVAASSAKTIFQSFTKKSS